MTGMSVPTLLGLSTAAIIAVSCSGQSQRFEIEGQVVSDTSTGLEWQRLNPEISYTWNEAQSYCEELYLGEHSDWRLPTLKELASLADYDKVNLAIDTEAFPSSGAMGLWSSTGDCSNSDWAWYLLMTDGRTDLHPVAAAGGMTARCVRAATGA